MRRSLFIRLLLCPGDDDRPERSAIEIEHVQSGGKPRVSGPEEAGQRMRDAKDNKRKDRHIKEE